MQCHSSRANHSSKLQNGPFFLKKVGYWLLVLTYDVVGHLGAYGVVKQHEPKAGACHPGFEPDACSIPRYTVYRNGEKSSSVQKKF
jgi:hypothetical protein